MPRRVLVVDDVRTAADIVGLLLRRLGHEAKTAYDGLSALALAEEFLPDAVFVDLAMPDMNGVQLARLLRARLGPSTKIIALTAYAERGFVEANKAAGFDGLLIKPATVKTITDVLTD